MTPKFGIGDTVRLDRTGLHAEVTELDPRHPDILKASWFDEQEDLQELWFAARSLTLVKRAEKRVEPKPEPEPEPEPAKTSFPSKKHSKKTEE